MKRMWIALAVTGLVLAGLAATQDRWMPEEFNRYWHAQWLRSGSVEKEDPREEILENHARLLAEIEQEYGEKIDREKKMNEVYQLEYNRLKNEGGGLMKHGKILIADDEENLCRILSRILRDEGYEVEVAHDGEKAIEKLNQISYDCLLTDVKSSHLISDASKVDGLTLLREARKKDPNQIAVVMTAYGNVQLAQEVMREGAFAQIYFVTFDEREKFRIKELTLVFDRERRSFRKVITSSMRFWREDPAVGIPVFPFYS